MDQWRYLVTLTLAIFKGDYFENSPGLLVFDQGLEAGLALGFYTLSLLIFYLVQKSNDRPLKTILLGVGLVGFTTASTHLLESLAVTFAWIKLEPFYLGFTSLKILATLGWLGLAFSGLRYFPQIVSLFSLPNSVALEQLNQTLTSQLQARNNLLEVVELTANFVGIADTQGHVIYVNQSGLKMVGRDITQDVTQTLVSDYHPDWATQQILQEAIPTAIQEGKWRGETALLHQDGTEIPVTQTIAAHKDLENHSVRFVSTIAYDISNRKQAEAALQQAKAELELRVELRTAELTEANAKLQRQLQERKQAELSLQASEEKFRQLAESIRDVFWITDIVNHQVIYVSPAYETIWGRSCQDLYQNPMEWLEGICPDDRQRVNDAFFAKAMYGEFSEEYRVVRSDGEIRWIRDRCFPIFNAAGEVYRVAGIAEDITERYAIERMKDEFISVVSHELRTPLTSIHGALNLLSTGLIPPESDRGQHVLKIASENSDRLVRLVNDILELERLESGKINLEKQFVQTRTLTYRAAELLQVKADRAGVSLALSDPDLRIEVDGDRIIQVLTNLLDNGIKFSPRGSTIYLTVTPTQEAVKLTPESPPQPVPMVLFTVKDQGRGIPEDKLESIFERFSQVDSTDSRRKGGTGLGLAICRSIVEQHGGRIWVASCLHQGSCFYFMIPMLTKPIIIS